MTYSFGMNESFLIKSKTQRAKDTRLAFPFRLWCGKNVY